MNKMEEILNDMDLALEGVPVGENNQNIQMGVAILEHNASNFNYSNNSLTLEQKILELKNYYFNNGYKNNEELLNVISSYKMGIRK